MKVINYRPKHYYKIIRIIKKYGENCKIFSLLKTKIKAYGKNNFDFQTNLLNILCHFYKRLTGRS